MSDSDRQTESYLRLLNEHERPLGAYVHTLVNDAADAEDILQACRLTLWKKFGDFEEGTNFLAWARRVALHQVLNFRRAEKRRPTYAADPQFIEAVAGEIDRQEEVFTDRAEALHLCLSRLPENQRRTVLLRYHEGFEVAEIASETRRTEAAVYRLLSRIRAALDECIEQRLAAMAARSSTMPG